MTFFVTGLPRSRTAWFAAFLSSMGAFCHHELVGNCSTREEFYVSLENAGDSDCALALTDFQQRFPEAPTLIIERDIGAVAASLEAQGYVTDWLEERKEAISKLKGLRLPFAEIDYCLELCCGYLNVPFDSERAKLFSTMRIERTRASLHRDLDVSRYNIWSAQ